MKTNPSLLTVIAMQAAMEAGELLKKGFGSSFEITSKPGDQNLVTEYDKRSESLIIAHLSRHFPDHAFLAEETHPHNPETLSSVLWIIDPLDGTVNFAHNVPVFSVSIAAFSEGNIVSGVIYQPMTDELFIAERGRGSYLNGKPCQVSKNRDLKKTLMATGFPYNAAENPLGCIDQFAYMTRQGVPIRRLGSAALDLAYLAAGRFDVYWEVSLHPWDIAAGQLIVEEAGGKVTGYQGEARDLFSTDPVLATNGLFHEEMISKLKHICQT